MGIPFFKILVPVIALLFCLALILRLKKAKITIFEGLFGIVFWLAVGLFAIFPDEISVFIAKIFGIKSNVNAIIFFCIGLIFFIQYKLYFLIKRQEKALTELTRLHALKEETEQKAS